jgi:hypothetical protein
LIRFFADLSVFFQPMSVSTRLVCKKIKHYLN